MLIRLLVRRGRMARQRTMVSMEVQLESRGIGAARVERECARSSTGLFNALTRAAKATKCSSEK